MPPADPQRDGPLAVIGLGPVLGLGAAAVAVIAAGGDDGATPDTQ